jgi:hypothetical protein
LLNSIAEAEVEGVADEGVANADLVSPGNLLMVVVQVLE